MSPGAARAEDRLVEDLDEHRCVTEEGHMDIGREWSLERLLEDASGAVRAAGVLVLGLAALNCVAARDALRALVPSCLVDPDVEVRRAMAGSLSNLSDDWVLPLLVRLLSDTDAEVRISAVNGLPLVLDDPDPDHPAVHALLGLLEEPDIGVRDAAAFVLGTQLDVDSPEIREGLRRRLDEPDTEDAYPAAEAAVGLARRHDGEVWQVIGRRLVEPGLGSLWLEAARDLADPRLLPGLLGLRAPDNEPDDPWVQTLEEAIASCTRD